MTLIADRIDPLATVTNKEQMTPIVEHLLQMLRTCLDNRLNLHLVHKQDRTKMDLQHLQAHRDLLVLMVCHNANRMY